MRWLYRLQARLGLTGPEGSAALVILLALTGGSVALHGQASSSPIPEDVYAAADAAFAAAAADTTRPEVSADVPLGIASMPGVDSEPADSTAADIATAAVETAAAPRRSGKPPPARTNINTASLVDLQRLPRIGPALAQRIIDYRAANGPFRHPDHIVEVRGIGEKTLEKLRPWIFI